MSDRINIFIDGINLFVALNEVFGRRIYFNRLAEKLAEGRRLLRMYYYDAPLSRRENRAAYEAQQEFFSHLRRIPYCEIRLGSLVQRTRRAFCLEQCCQKKVPVRTWEQKGVDVLLAVELLSLAVKNEYDVAILISGDKDLVNALLEVKALGKTVENGFVVDTAGKEYGWHEDLRTVADKVICLNGVYLADCWR